MVRNLYLIRGDTLSFTFQVTGVTSNLTSAYFSVKKNIDDTRYAIQKTLSNGITKVTSDTNSVTYQVRCAPSDTNALNDVNYVYDLQIGVGSDIYTILKGRFVVDKDVTRNGG